MDEAEEIRDGDIRWRFDHDFLTSRWTCIWGRGCKGIGAEPAEDLGLGCCSVGADLGDEDEARRIDALSATIDGEMFQHHRQAGEGGIFADGSRTSTRVVDGACIFLNRPGFAGGAGCALHLAAIDSGEPTTHWKPSVCWQLPVKIDWESQSDGTETATLRRWTRRDWGEEGETMAWCCTEGSLAYVADSPVIDSLGEELEEIVGTRVYLELRRRTAASRPRARGPSPAQHPVHLGQVSSEAMVAHHSELTEGQLGRLSDVLRRLGTDKPFSAGEALTAALGAGVVNDSGDIGSALDDLEDAGVLRQVQKNPPRWQAAEAEG